MDVLIDGKRVRVDTTRAIGKGGEADIYDIGKGKALKLYKPPSHPDYTGMPNEQAGAEQRIKEHQQKLPGFPRNLPARAGKPIALATDLSGATVIGYVLEFITPAEVLLRYSERKFRESGVSDQETVAVLRSLHDLVDAIHAAEVVIGDFNDLNVLVKGNDAYLIDLDSAQFGPWLSRVFTATFVDPLLCDPNAKRPMLAKPHSALSDWYAYAIMVMQSLLYVGPYGGVYKPGDPSKRIVHETRPLRRITVFDPEVRYPKPARPLQTLPDTMLSHFMDVFVRDRRDVFPVGLFERLRFDPQGSLLATLAEPVAPVRVKEVVTGTLRANKVFDTTGRILHVAVQGGKLLYLYHHEGTYYREDGMRILSGDLDRYMRYRIQGKRTVLAKGTTAFLIDASGVPDRFTVDTYGQLPLIDATEESTIYVDGGELRRIGSMGVQYPERIGDVLAHQTLFWVGPTQGFGFYRAGNLTRYFMFPAKGVGINDSIRLPPMRGQLIDSTCYFGATSIWFALSVREGAETVNRCYVLNPRGALVASYETTAGDGSWFGTIRGKCAIGNMLLAPTDDGIVRVEVNGTSLAVTREFPDTARFVDTETRLFPGGKGLWAVQSNRTIWSLQIT